MASAALCPASEKTISKPIRAEPCARSASMRAAILLRSQGQRPSRNWETHQYLQLPTAWPASAEGAIIENASHTKAHSPATTHCYGAARWVPKSECPRRGKPVLGPQRETATGVT